MSIAQKDSSLSGERFVSERMKRRAISNHRYGTQWGFTLAELIISITVMSMLSLTVASLSVGLANARESTEGFYHSMQVARNGLRRVQGQINQSNLVTALYGTSLAYWGEDTNRDGLISPSELRYIWYDATQKQLLLSRIKYPEDWPQDWINAYDYPVSLSWATSVWNVRSWLTYAYWEERTVLAVDVTAVRFITDTAPPLGKTLQVEITIGDEPQKVSLRGSASLRMDWVSHVGVVSGYWALDTEL